MRIAVEDEAGFLNALRANPHDDLTRAVYADWLEERSDPRAEFLRLQTSVKSLPWFGLEKAATIDRLRELRKQVAAEWLNVVEPLTLLGKLSIRTKNRMRAARITTIGELCELTEDQVICLGTGAFTPPVLFELRSKLGPLGLRFRTTDVPG